MTNPTAPSPKPSTRLGRTAWMVLLLGLALSGAMIGVTYIVGGRDSWRGNVDLLPVFGMALAIAGVSVCWAVVLAVRALRAGEPSGGPIWLINVATLVPAAYCFAHLFPLPQHFVLRGNSVTYYYLPVLVPFFSFVCILGTLLVRPVVRWMERRRERAGQPLSTRGSRIKRSVVLLLIFGAMMSGLMLPMLIFLQCTVSPRETAGFVWVCSNTPEVYRDAAESILHAVPISRWHDFRNQEILRSGRASLARLKLRCLDANTETRAAALKGAAKLDPQWAGDLAVAMANDPTVRSNRILMYSIDWVLSDNGSTAQRRALLEDAMKSTTKPVSAFMMFLSNHKTDEALIPTLKAVLVSGVPDREFALLPLLQWLPEDDAVALVIERLKAGDKGVERLLLTRYFSSEPSIVIGVYRYIFEQPDLNLKRRALDGFVYPEVGPMPKRRVDRRTPDRVALVKKLLELLAGNDIPCRRGAAMCLYRFIIASDGVDAFTGKQIESYAWKNGVFDPADPTKPVETGGAPVPLSPGEKQVFDEIRATVEEWVKKQEGK